MKKILVIDDDVAFRMAVVTTLRRKNYEVFDAGDGTEGLAQALAKTPSLVLSDVNMAGRNGFELLKELRLRPETSAIPVIIMTGEPQKADARFSMEQGADDYLKKPFTMPEMLAAVAARLQRQAGINLAVDAQHQAERLSTAEKMALQTSALDAAANGIAITDAKGKVLWVNPAFTKLTGYAAEEVVGGNPRVLKSGHHSPNFYARMWAAISSGQVWHGELLNKRKDGSCYYEEMTITPVCGAGGEIQNFIAIKQDVSERKKIEYMLAQERDLLQVLMDNLPDYIYFKDNNSCFTRINGALARHLGLRSPDEAIGKSDADFFPPHEARQKLAEERSLLTTGGTILGLVERSATAQETKWVCSTKVPVYGFDSKITGLVGISHDITERQRTEEELQRKTALLEAQLNSSIDGILVVDEQDHKVLQNQRLTELFRIPQAVAEDPNDEQQRNWVMQLVNHPEQFLNKIRHLNSHRSEISRDEIELKDGMRIDRYSAPMLGRDGKFYGRLWTFRDITEQKQTEEELQRQRTELRLLFDLMPAMLWFKDTQDRILRVNQRAAEAAGKSVAEMEGKAAQELYPQDGARLYADDQEVIRSGVPKLGIVETIRDSTGNKLWVQTDKVPYHDQEGKVIGIITMAQNITERRLFEAQMERLRNEHAVVLNALGEGVHWIDNNGLIKFENPAAAKMLGFETSELIGKSAHPIMHHTRADGTAYPQEDCCIYATLHDRTERRVTGEVFWRKDGTSFPVDYICTPVYEKTGNPDGCVVIFTDITERRRLESQLVQAQKLETVGQLAAGIAHEINTPTQYVGDNTRFVKESFADILKVLRSHQDLLAAAKANAITPELLARHEEILAAGDLDYLCKQIPSALEETLEGVERVSKIVRAMKEFSHPGGKEKSPADLNKAIQSTVTVANNEWKYVASMILELEPELPLVPCFIGEFNQCILNLIINAAHAIADVVGPNPQAKGCITVRTRRDGEFVEVRVSDTGTGIAEEARPKIFEPFFTTKDVGKGTGQGLSIVYACIVKRHGGTVTFETEIGHGTMFIIRLPLKSAATPETKPAVQPEARTP